MITKEEAIKNVYKQFEIAAKIKSNYSSEDVYDKFNEVYLYIIFTNYIDNLWELISENKNSNFLRFYGLNFSIKDKLTFFYFKFRHYIDFFELKGNNLLTEKFTIRDFFEKEEYLLLNEEDLNNLYVVHSKHIKINEFWDYFYQKYIEEFLSGIYYGYYDTLLTDKIYKDEKKTIINTLSYLYSVLGNTFEINQEMFNKKQKVSFMEFVISYFYLGFISIKIADYNNKSFTYEIKILPELAKILDEIEEKRNLILDKVFDEKYNEIKIKKEKGEISFIEGEINIYGDNEKFVELKKQYPFSDIISKVHDGKISKYQIIEKIKLKKDTE